MQRKKRHKKIEKNSGKKAEKICKNCYRHSDLTFDMLISSRCRFGIYAFRIVGVKKSVSFLSNKATHFVSKNEHLFLGQKRPKFIFFSFRIFRIHLSKSRR
jgi:hypothetical protein